MAQFNDALQQKSVQELAGVGPIVAKKLAKLAIFTLHDLLFYLPFRYQDRTRVTPMQAVRVGTYALIEGKIISSHITFGKNQHCTVCISDGHAPINLHFFHFNAHQKRHFKPGTPIRCFGEMRSWQNRPSLIHPEYWLNQDTAIETHLTPIYSTINGLTQFKWRQLTTQALHYLTQQHPLIEYLPASVRTQYHWLPLMQALQYVHRPPSNANMTLLNTGLHPVQQRLAFEELLAYQLSMRQLRRHYQQHRAIALRSQSTTLSLFLANLGFTLTPAQTKVWQQVAQDLALPKPMRRLVQGDVGCGKTVIAALAALCAVQHGSQVALMAPTELLAEQHFQQFQQWFKPLHVQVECLTAKLSTPLRRHVLENMALGLSQMVIGTHALFQKSVRFKQLALVIVDEQHRFGVQQRLTLREKGATASHYPHQLMLTATPIPRSLAMVAYADLAISVIDQLPPGRKPVTTLVANNERRDEMIARVHQLCRTGGQAYWICPLIAESDARHYEAVETVLQYLRRKLTGLRIDLIHGRLSSQAKERAMSAFQHQQISVLVATTVVEVGVHVANATLMVIENAERLGLAQLHQLRGRVGRGRQHSYCILLYQRPLSTLAHNR